MAVAFVGAGDLPRRRGAVGGSQPKRPRRFVLFQADVALDVDNPSAIGTDLRIGDALEAEKVLNLHRSLLGGGLSGRPCGGYEQDAESEPRTHKSVLSRVNAV